MVSLSCEDFAAHVHRDLARQVAARHGRGHLGDVAHLAGEVGGHGVHGVGEILPRAGDAGHRGLAAELSFGAHLARHARHFGREAVELVHHRVDGFLEQQDFAAHVHRDLARQVARATAVVTSAMLRTWLVRLDAMEFTLSVRSFHTPDTPCHLGLAAQLSFGAHFARHARHFGGERSQLVHHRVDGFLQLQDFAAHVHRDLARQVAVGDRRGHLGDVAHLAGEVRRPWSSRCR